MIQLRILEKSSSLHQRAHAQLYSIAKLAGVLTGCPMALISGGVNQKQDYRIAYGLKEVPAALPIQFSLIDNGLVNILEVQDTLKINELKDHPAVLGNPFIRYIAGMPIMGRAYQLGTLLVMDHRPRSMAEDQQASLNELCDMAAYILEQESLLHEVEESSQLYFDEYGSFFISMNRTLRSMLNSLRGAVNLIAQDKPARHQWPYLKTLKDQTNDFVGVLDKLVAFSQSMETNPATHSRASGDHQEPEKKSPESSMLSRKLV